MINPATKAAITNNAEEVLSALHEAINQLDLAYRFCPTERRDGDGGYSVQDCVKSGREIIMATLLKIDREA